MTFHILLEHPVPDFDAWKLAFDADPLDREAAGVRAYRVLRPTDGESRVAVDLAFDDLAHATAFHAALLRLWATSPARAVMANPQIRVVSVVDERSYP